MSKSFSLDTCAVIISVCAIVVSINQANVAKKVGSASVFPHIPPFQRNVEFFYLRILLTIAFAKTFNIL